MADRQEPWAVPSYGRGGQNGFRHIRVTFGTVASLNPYNGAGTIQPVGTGQFAPVATPVLVRKDTAMLSRLPVSVVRNVWARFSYAGVHSADNPAPLPGASATPGPSGIGGIGGQP